MLPNRSAWSQVIKTAFPAFGLIGVYWAMEIWRFTLWLIMFYSTAPDVALLPLVVLACLIPISFLWFAFTLLVYRWVLRLFWSNPPSWLRIGSRVAILRAWAVMLVATFPSATIAFWGLNVFDLPVRQSLIEVLSAFNLGLFACLWGLCAAYLFHWLGMLSPRRGIMK